MKRSVFAMVAVVLASPVFGQAGGQGSGQGTAPVAAKPSAVPAMLIQPGGAGGAGAGKAADAKDKAPLYDESADVKQLIGAATADDTCSKRQHPHFR